MPYPNEFAHKLAHCPLVANAEVRKTVMACTVARPPSPCAQLAPGIQSVAPACDLPDELRIIASDGSRWELNFNRRQHRFGYIQLGRVQFSLQEYASLTHAATVDPFAAARLMRQRQVWGLCLPSSYVWWGPCTSVRESIRALFEEFLASTRPDNSANSLRDTLFQLASDRPGPLATWDDRFLRLHKCPACCKGPVVVARNTDESICPHCEGRLFAGDCLRIFEEVLESESNENVFTRMMLVLEQLLLIHHLEALAQNQPDQLANSVWFMDGPLALFGPASWLHAPIQSRLHEINKRVRADGNGFLTLVGVQKTGRLIKHAQLLGLQMPRRSIFPIGDDYRYRHVILSRAPNSAGFGRQTHYGQDFIYHAVSGQVFVFSLPYPFARKNSPVFDYEKIELSQYAQLPRVLALLEKLASSRFPSAIVPTLLAHQATAISRRPGGDVLTLFTKQQIGKPGV